MPNPNSVHVGILVRVEWPIGDDPQNKALKFLAELLSAGSDEFFYTPHPNNPYFTNGNIAIQPDAAHDLISVFYASKE